MEPDAEDMSSGAGSSTTTATTTSSGTTTATSTATTPSPSPGRAAGIKCCSGCQTTKTPLWRGGPDGPKSLCNACGIRYRKRRREVLGITDDHPAPTPSATPADAMVPIKKRKHASSHNNQSSSPADAPKVNVLRLFPKQGERLLDQRLLLWLKTRQRHSRLREEEQAAVLLMALSCGILYA